MFESLSTLQQSIANETIASFQEVFTIHPQTRALAEMMQPVEFEVIGKECLDYMSRVDGRPIFSDLNSPAEDATRFSQTCMMAIQKTGQFSQIVLADAEVYSDIRKLIEGKALAASLRHSESA